MNPKEDQASRHSLFLLITCVIAASLSGVALRGKSSANDKIG